MYVHACGFKYIYVHVLLSIYMYSYIYIYIYIHNYIYIRGGRYWLILYRGIGKNIEFQLNTGIPLTPNIYVHVLLRICTCTLE